MPTAEEVKFLSLMNTVALEDCAASFSGSDVVHQLRLFRQLYIDAGRPADQRGWLREQLRAYFRCVDERPRWVGRKQTPEWPWAHGRPMLFVRQFTMPATALPHGHEMASNELFVFCTDGPPLVSTVDGWTAEFRVVAQDPKFPW